MELAAITLVEAFLKAGSGRETKEQWEYLADRAGYPGLPDGSTREEIGDQIKKDRASFSERSFWLMAPPKVESKDGAVLTLVAIYGSKVVKNDKPFWGASESRFEVVFGPDSKGSLSGFVPSRSTFAGSLSEVDQFEFVYDRWSELAFSKRYPSTIRDRWLALMTQQLYVMAGNSYDESSLNGISVEARVKIQNQTEFFAETLDFFDDGRVSRLSTAKDLADYVTKWPNRSLTNLSEPLVGDPDPDGIIEVTGQLNSRTENEEKIIELVVPSRIRVRSDPDRGPEIVWIRGGAVPGSIKETPKVVPRSERPNSLLRKLFPKKD
ncbi:MAG: hypothetical protein KC931_24545, partial [Candidatus Omnitrophica bacterium]|nr:hypothetical protein [Candidatus Omnitrophota bacterium]